VYFLSDKGVMTVVRPGPKLEIVARNELNEETYASPALRTGQIFLRGVQHLYCIRNNTPNDPPIGREPSRPAYLVRDSRNQT
jgi:hypothetical protein